MPVYKMQCIVGADTSLQRDRMIITPHFRDDGALTDPENLADDLATALDTWFAQTREVTVKAYNVATPKPNYPVGMATKSPNKFPASVIPREIALCLSFYGDRNVKRERGRLYLPGCWSTGPVTLRPTSGQISWLASIVPLFTALGGPDVDWGVWSSTGNKFTPAKNWWIDDEWDIQRRRGMRGNNRTVGTTTEA